MSGPIVSVIIPTYNRVDMVTKSIDSVLAQDFDGFEIIVSDDGSTDNTAQVLSKYGDKIRTIYGPNKGTPTAITRAVSIAQGEFFALLGSDDLMLPGRLTAQVKFLLEHPEVVAVGGNLVLQDQEKVNYFERCGINFNGQKWIILERPFQQLIRRNFMTDAASMIRRKCFLEVGGYDLSFRRAADWDLWLRIARQWPLACMNMPCTWVGRHQNNIAIQSSLLTVECQMRVIDKALRYHEPIDEDTFRAVRGRLWGLTKRYVRSGLEGTERDNWKSIVRNCAAHLPCYQRIYPRLVTSLPRQLCRLILHGFTYSRAALGYVC